MTRKIRRASVSVGVALAVVTALGGPAGAAPGADRDRDGMPDRYEALHRLDPRNPADAPLDLDRDGLTNLQEFKVAGDPRDEDTDNDGHDDGDEAQTRTKVKVADSDRDRIPDGDEDADRDGTANEDEDDAAETCQADDDDVDGDHVDDEDENELRLKVGRADADGDRVPDGEEDRDGDGEANEDEDDDPADVCSGDGDGDGEDDEDAGDRFGTITSFDPASSVLVVSSLAGSTITVTVTEETEIEFDAERAGSRTGALGGDENDPDEQDGDDEADISALVAGTSVSELEVDRETGELEEIELL